MVAPDVMTGSSPTTSGFLDGLRALAPDIRERADDIERGRRVPLDLVRRLADKGLGVLLISHNMADVLQVADRITADFGRLDPAHRNDYRARRAAVRQAMQPYRDLIEAIRTKWKGARVGATETVFEYMAEALGLDLASPRAFMRAVAEGTDPPAASVADFQRQLGSRTIKVLVFNAQTATAVTTNLERQARKNGIATVAVTETMPRRFPTFQAWQVAQLRALQRALRQVAA